MRFDTVFFDLDGTLTDSGEGILNSVSYAMEQSGFPVPERQELFRFVGPPLITELQAALGVTREKAEEMVPLFRRYFVEKGMFENRVYDGIPAVLEVLRAAGGQVVLATSKPEVFAEKILEMFDLRKYFAHVAGSGLDEKSRTTKTEVVAYALQKCGADPSRVLMVGDRSHDVLGAHANGVACMGVLYGYGSRRELEEAGADAITETVATLQADLLKGFIRK